ncbi:MAG: hypothetical protein J6X45_04455 [Lachnospiraceae bacterium]|nr:hypothetical protein [Lachnospiraceae bacterium]
MTKTEWEKKLKEKGFGVVLDSNVLMLKTESNEEEEEFRKAVKDYPYSWGIKRGGEINDESGILQDFDETEECE